MRVRPVLFAALVVCLALIPVPASAMPAINTPTDCQLAPGAVLPAADPVSTLAGTPLEGTDPDCVVDVTGGDDEPATLHGTSAVVLYRDGYPRFLDIVERFASAGWEFFGGSVTEADGSSRVLESLADLPDDADTTVNAQFSRGGTASTSASLSWTPAATDTYSYSSHYHLPDGEEFAYDNLTGPVLAVGLISYATAADPGIATPSVLSQLKTIGEAAPNPVQTAVIGGSAAVLMLVVGYPGYLLSGVIAGHYDRIVGRRFDAWRASVERTPRRRRVVLAAGLLVAAILTGFIDPGFGLNGWSVRLVLTALLAFAAFNIGGAAVVRTVVRRIEPSAEATIRFRWGSIVVLAAAVVLCRLLAFEPGVLFGIVSGLVFGTTLALSRRGIVVLIGSGFAAAVGLLGWIGYSLLAPLADAAPGNLPAVFATELLSAFAIEGIATLPLALLPFAGLEGAALRRWKPWAWVVSYLLAAALFVLILVTLPASWGAVSGDVLRWTIVFAAFSAVAVGVWALDRHAAARRAGTAASETLG